MNAKTPANALRALPSVDALISSVGGVALVERYGRTATVDMLRALLDETRTRLRAGETAAIDSDSLLDSAAARLHTEQRGSLVPVINATGVIIHTNLGRAPLSDEALDAVRAIGGGYSTLEYDLDAGARGSRLKHPETLLCTLTGAESALVVNNNAAATVLMLAAFARGREVIVSRGQLVEIGGGFRVPDIMAESGATLIEIGTTNRTRAADYERAITENTAALMRVHSSNFKQVGFVEETPIADIARIAQAHGIAALDDLGSGALLDSAAYGLAHEPLPQESLQAGMDLVAFSGDKLLGGPQAGILIGKRELVEKLKRHPLARAFRADKMTLAALVATLLHYRKGEAVEKIPVWRMIARPLADVHAQAEAWAVQVGGSVIDGESTVGGGSLPGATLPTALLALDMSSVDIFAANLRRADPPLIARIQDGHVVFDPRTVLPGQAEMLIEIVKRTLQSDT
ncbi:MAG: L-seryl-tRNA(Sec) selenium transferase [Anaerolineae bacterium]|nr:L-seryl-tRNA(Sec) selenium transferase [Anaerolineae bacterium]